MSLYGPEQDHNSMDGKEFVSKGLQRKAVVIPQLQGFLETFYSSGNKFRDLVDKSSEYDRPTIAFESMFFGRATDVVGQPYVGRLGSEHKIKPTGFEGYLVGAPKLDTIEKLNYIAQIGINKRKDIIGEFGQSRFDSLTRLLQNKPIGNLKKEEQQFVWTMGELTFREVIGQFKGLYKTMDSIGQEEHDAFRNETYRLISDSTSITYNHDGMSFWLSKEIGFHGEPYGVDFDHKTLEGHKFIRQLRMFTLPPIRVGMQMWHGEFDRGKREWYLKHLKNG